MSQQLKRDVPAEIRRAMAADNIGKEFDSMTKGFGLKEQDHDFYAVKAGLMSVEIAKLRERLADAEHRLKMQEVLD